MKKRGTGLVAVANVPEVISVIIGASYKLLFSAQVLKLFVPRGGTSHSIYESPGGFDYKL